MKIFKFCAAIAMTAALMTAQPVFGATGHSAGFTFSGGPDGGPNGNANGGPNGGPNNNVNQVDAVVPETGSTFALLFVSFFALMGATRLASFRQRKRKVV